MKEKFLIVIALFIMPVSSVFSSPLGWRPDVEVGIPYILSYS